MCVGLHELQFADSITLQRHFPFDDVVFLCMNHIIFVKQELQRVAVGPENARQYRCCRYIAISRLKLYALGPCGQSCTLSLLLLLLLTLLRTPIFVIKS